MRRRAPAASAALVLAAAALWSGATPVAPVRPGLAQAESREGIYLQNQILQLRQELELLRRGAGGGSALGAPVPRGGAAAPAGPSRTAPAAGQRFCRRER